MAVILRGSCCTLRMTSAQFKLLCSNMNTHANKLKYLNAHGFKLGYLHVMY